MKLPWHWLLLPRCGRCGSEEVSNVTVEVRGREYKLCAECFDAYLRIEAQDEDQLATFIQSELPDSIWGRVKFCCKHKKVKWYWLKPREEKK